MRNGNEFRENDTHNSSASGHNERCIQSIANRPYPQNGQSSTNECEDDGWITVYSISLHGPRNRGSNL